MAKITVSTNPFLLYVILFCFIFYHVKFRRLEFFWLLHFIPISVYSDLKPPFCKLWLQKRLQNVSTARILLSIPFVYIKDSLTFRRLGITMFQNLILYAFFFIFLVFLFMLPNMWLNLASLWSTNYWSYNVIVDVFNVWLQLDFLLIFIE